MAHRSQTLGLVVMLALATACGRGPKSCEVCQRPECVGLGFRLTFTDGSRVETCCPRCALHYVATARPAPREWQATDYANGQWIDATTAVFVEGSDVAHCSAMEVKRDAQGCCLYKKYDRCQPSLIAFATKPAAEQFQKEHGGKLVAFEKLDRP